MTTTEFAALFSQSVDQIKDITRKATAPNTELSRLISASRQMRANEDAQVYGHLTEAFDDRIFKVEGIKWDEQSHRKVMMVGNFEIEVTVIHREPTLEKSTGVDVLYNLGDIKVLLFQHKKRSSEGGLRFGNDDQSQMKKISEQCTECSHSKIIKRGRFVRHNCASMYVVGDVASTARHVVSACELYKYRKKFRRHDDDVTGFDPISIPSIDAHFVGCRVGRILDVPRLHDLVGQLEKTSVDASHVLLNTALRLRQT